MDQTFNILMNPLIYGAASSTAIWVGFDLYNGSQYVRNLGYYKYYYMNSNTLVGSTAFTVSSEEMSASANYNIKFNFLYSGLNGVKPYNSFSFRFYFNNIYSISAVSYYKPNLVVSLSQYSAANGIFNVSVTGLRYWSDWINSGSLSINNGFDNVNGNSFYEPISLQIHPKWYEYGNVISNPENLSVPPADCNVVYPLEYIIDGSTTSRCRVDSYPDIDATGGLFGALKISGSIGITPYYIEHFGYVKDTYGKSIRNASIILTRSTNNNTYTTLTKNNVDTPFTTNSAGYFEFYDVQNFITGYSSSLKVTADHYNTITTTTTAKSCFTSTNYNNLILNRNKVTLSGRVTNAIGNGVSGVTLSLTADTSIFIDDPATSVVTTTDANGYYSVIVDEGVYTILTCSKTGVTSQTYTNLTPLNSGNLTVNFTNFNVLTNVKVNLTDTYRLTNVTGATITFVSSYTTVNLDSAYTGKLLPDIYAVTISKTGYITQTFVADLRTGQDLYTFNISFESNIVILTGTIRNVDTGTTISSAIVLVAGVGQVYSNSSGVYKIELTPSAAYTISVSYGTLKPLSVTTGILTRGIVNRDFSLSAYGIGYLTGKVTNTAALPISGVTITPSNSVYNTNVQTGSDGMYNTTVKEGTYSIKALKTYYDTQAVSNIYVGSGLTASYNFTNFTRNVGDVSGWVKDELGQYVHGADIAYGNYKTKSVTGSYILENITPVNGIYVTASYTRHYLASAGPVNIIADQLTPNNNITFDAYRAKIHGNVLDFETNQPVSPCDVYTSYDTTIKTAVLPDGTFQSDAYLPMGNMTVYAVPDDKIHNSTSKTINIPDKTSDVLVNFSLTRKTNCILQGYVYTNIQNTNVKLDGVTIEVISNTDGTIYSVLTDSNGYYKLALYVDTWSISVTKNNYGSQTDSATFTSNTTISRNYTLTSSLPVANLSGYVSGSDGKRIKSKVDFGSANTVYLTVTPSTSGYYSITNIPQDTYKLKAYHALTPKIYSDVETNLSFAFGESKSYNFVLPALVNFSDYTNWTYKNEVIGNGTIIASYIDTLKFAGNVDTLSNVYDEINSTLFYNSDNPLSTDFVYSPYSLEFNSTDNIDVINFINILQATYGYNFVDYINTKYGTDILSDIYTPLSHPTAINFDIIATAHTILGINKDIISYNPVSSILTTDYSILPDITTTGSISIKSHNFDISVLSNATIAKTALQDLYLKTNEFHQFTGSYVPNSIPTTMPLYASALPTTLNYIESSAFSNIGVASNSVYVLGGKTYLEEHSNNFFKLTPTQIGNKQYISATNLGETPGKNRFGGVSFTIADKIYYGMGVVATWLGIPYHLDQDRIPDSNYEYLAEEEHIYNYGIEAITGIDNTEFYAFSGYNNFYKYSDGTWTDLSPSRSFPISSYSHQKHAHMEIDPSHYIYNTLYESKTGNVLLTRFDKGYTPINVKVVATANVPTTVRPMFANSHSDGEIISVSKWNIFVDDSYDATPTAPSFYCTFSYDYPVDGVRWRYGAGQDWQIIASYSVPVNSGYFTLTPDESDKGKDALVIRHYELQGLSVVKNSLIASVGPIAIDKIPPIASIMPLHKTGVTVNTGKYFTDYIYAKDYETSIVELYVAGVPSTISSTIYSNVFTATIPYNSYSRSISPGVSTISYKFTPSFSSGYNQIWVKAIDASNNTLATSINIYVDASVSDTITPSLVSWIKPTMCNALSVIPSQMNLVVYDGVQLNDMQYRYSRNDGVYSDWQNIYYTSSDYKTGNFNIDITNSADGYYTYNIKVSDTSLNTSTYIGTYIIDKVYPTIEINNINGGLVPLTNASKAPEFTKLLHFPIEVNYYDNYSIGTGWCNIDGVSASLMGASLTGTRLYQKWQPVATLTPTFHYFTAYGQDLVGNIATSNYYILCSPTRVFSPTGFALHRNEIVEI